MNTLENYLQNMSNPALKIRTHQQDASEVRKIVKAEIIAGLPEIKTVYLIERRALEKYLKEAGLAKTML